MTWHDSMTDRRDRGDAVVHRCVCLRCATVWAVQMRICRSFLRAGSSLETVRTPAPLALLSGRHALSSDCPDPLAPIRSLPACVYLFMPPPASPAAGLGIY